MSYNLLQQKRFGPYFVTMFLGAFNDNIYKNALMIAITYRLLVENHGILVNVAAVLFILPFFLFGALAGQIADKYEKSLLVQRIKIAEIVIMFLGCLAFYLNSLTLMLFVLFLLGAQSTFFGPIKYSILPQHLERDEILLGNSYVEAGTFLAILLGTILGGVLASKEVPLQLLMVTLLLVATVGWISSRKIPAARASLPDLNISFNVPKSTWQVIALARENKPVFLSILAISWFWFIGSIILSQFPAFAKIILSGDELVATTLLATFSVGIALGSMACYKLSSGRVEVGLMPVGALGISIFTWLLGTTAVPFSLEVRSITDILLLPSAWPVMIYMTMIAFSSGLFIVPMYAFIQVRSEESKRARIFACNNIINSAFMVVAGLLAITVLNAGYTILELFKLVAVLNILMTIYIISVVPDFFFRLLGWCLIHSIYRIEKEDLHHIPETGAALLVCNHVSYLDPVIINAISPRPIRFIMIKRVYDWPIVNRLFKWVKAIPITPKKDDGQTLERAYDKIAEALANGELVCIFPEGAISRDGELADFKPGLERIIERTPVNVVPLAIQGLWGTWFSRRQGGAMRGWPQSFMKRLSVVSAAPIPAEIATIDLLQEQVLELRGDNK